jgi:hypothetical protein
VTQQSTNKETPCICNFPSHKQVYSPVVYPVLLRILTNRCPYSRNSANNTLPIPWILNGSQPAIPITRQNFFFLSQLASCQDTKRVSLHNSIIGTRNLQTDPLSHSIKCLRSSLLSGDADTYFFSIHDLPAVSVLGHTASCFLIAVALRLTTNWPTNRQTSIS